jgi:hypothetical protein
MHIEPLTDCRFHLEQAQNGLMVDDIRSSLADSSSSPSESRFGKLGTFGSVEPDVIVKRTWLGPPAQQ